MADDAVVPRLFELSGSVLGGRYEVLEPLGEGGMATVYVGRRIGLERRVAIKVLRPELASDPKNVHRFLREARAASLIGHEHIVRIEDFGDVDRRPVYYVMEYLDGRDLRRVLEAGGPMHWEQARAIALQVTAALQAAHDHGIVHRDVKPGNIFLVGGRGGPRVKVLDFGIAKVVTEGKGLTKGLTQTDGILGTVAYMAPEQAMGQALDARTDVYQVGVVLYRMLTGVEPFAGRNPFAVIDRHIREPPKPLRELRAGIPQELESIVLTCLAKRPEERFQSMRALASALAGLDARATAPIPVATLPASAAGEQTEFATLPSIVALPRAASAARKTEVAAPVPTRSAAPMPGEAGGSRRSTAAAVVGFGASMLGIGAIAGVLLARFFAMAHPDERARGAAGEASLLVTPVEVPPPPRGEPEPRTEPPRTSSAVTVASEGSTGEAGEESEEATPPLADPRATPKRSPGTRRKGRSGEARAAPPVDAGEQGYGPAFQAERPTTSRLHPDLKEPYPR